VIALGQHTQQTAVSSLELSSPGITVKPCPLKLAVTSNGWSYQDISILLSL